MKKKKNIGKVKTLMVLTIMTTITKKYDNVNKACIFALNGEKSRAKKREVRSAAQKTLMFFHRLPPLEIDSTDEAVLKFCRKASIMLIDNSFGNIRVRAFEEIKNSVESQLMEVKFSVDGTSDSQKLFNELE